MKYKDYNNVIEVSTNGEFFTKNSKNYRVVIEDNLIQTIEDPIPEKSPTIKKVETIEFFNNKSAVKQDGSDSKSTRNAINSFALDWGPISPGETSQTKIIKLRIPSAIGVSNIKLGLINSGNIDFKNTIFGIETRNNLDYNIVPENYFQGVNYTKISSSSLNIDVPNSGRNESVYVYLNFNLPKNYIFKGETIRYKWFFDYVSGTSN